MPSDRIPVSQRIIKDVARSTGEDALDLPPLYGSIDPDALDAIVEGPGDVSVSFTYADHEIRVESDGEISLEGESRLLRGAHADD